MIELACGPSCAFSLISWLVLVQSKDDIHKKKLYQLLNSINYIIHPCEDENERSRQYINSYLLPYFFLTWTT